MGVVERDDGDGKAIAGFGDDVLAPDDPGDAQDPIDDGAGVLCALKLQCFLTCDRHAGPTVGMNGCLHVRDAADVLQIVSHPSPRKSEPPFFDVVGREASVLGELRIHRVEIADVPVLIRVAEDEIVAPLSARNDLVRVAQNELDILR